MDAASIADPDVAAVFAAWPPPVRAKLEALRALILETARAEGVGDLVETLKWGEPAYLPAKPRTGTTVRLNALKEPAAGYGLFVNCRTTLADDIRGLYPGVFRFEGDRALLFDLAEDPPAAPLAHAIALALTYHRRRR